MPNPKEASVLSPRNRRSKGKRFKGLQSTGSGSSSSSGQCQNPAETKDLHPCQAPPASSVDPKEASVRSPRNRRSKGKRFKGRGKIIDEKTLSELRKLQHCDLCGVDGHHTAWMCPYESDIPRDVKTLPPAYDIECKSCHGIVGRGECTCLDFFGYEKWPRCAVMKHCPLCNEMGTHWLRDCPEAAKKIKAIQERRSKISERKLALIEYFLK